MNFFSALFRYRDRKSPDKLGLYPERFHLEAFPERRYLWTSRVLAIFSVLSFCFTIILTMTVYLLLPQKNTAPVFYTAAADNNALEKAQPMYLQTSYRDMLSEKYIHEYVKMRHAIPKSSADLFYRWDTESKFYWFSSLRNYYDFINKMDNNQLKQFIKMRMKRQVDIDWSKKLTDNLWLVQFRTTTTTKELPEPNIIIWRAYLRITYLEFDKYEDIEKDEEEKLNYTTNPFGFKVISYSLAYAGKPEKADSAMETAKKVFEDLEDVVQ